MLDDCKLLSRLANNTTMDLWSACILMRSACRHGFVNLQRTAGLMARSATRPVARQAYCGLRGKTGCVHEQLEQARHHSQYNNTGTPDKYQPAQPAPPGARRAARL